MSQSNTEEAMRFDDQGRELFHASKYAEAIVAYDRAIAVDPNGKFVPMFLTDKGQALMALKRWAEAAQAFQTALQIYPQADLAQKELKYCLSKMHG